MYTYTYTYSLVYPAFACNSARRHVTGHDCTSNRSITLLRTRFNAHQPFGTICDVLSDITPGAGATIIVKDSYVEKEDSNG